MNSLRYPSRPHGAPPPVPPYLQDQDERSLRSGAGSASITYAMDTSRTYASPLSPPNGFVHAASSTGLSGRYYSDTESYLFGQEVHENCKKLEASNRTMRCIFWVLVTACVLVILVYLGLIVFLVASLHELGKSPSTQKNQKNCVGEKQVEEFWTSYDNKNENVQDFLKKIAGFKYSSSEKRYCFENLTWVPRLMGKIKAKVEENMEYIEDKQQKINQTVSAYSSANSTQHTCDTDESRSKSLSDPSKSVFAHFFLDTRQYEEQHSGTEAKGDGTTSPLPWMREGTLESIRRGIDVNIISGTFTIRNSGFYYVYSHLLFKNSARARKHRIVRIEKHGQEGTLLESQVGPASLLQGVFMLQKNDAVVVQASDGQLHTARSRSTFFGLYLIRT